MNGQRPVEAVRDNAAVVASCVNKEGWRIGEEPMVASPCRCATPAYCRDELLGTRCVKCGRRRVEP